MTSLFYSTRGSMAYTFTKLVHQSLHVLHKQFPPSLCRNGMCSQKLCHWGKPHHLSRRITVVRISHHDWILLQTSYVKTLQRTTNALQKFCQTFSESFFTLRLLTVQKSHNEQSSNYHALVLALLDFPFHMWTVIHESSQPGHSANRKNKQQTERTNEKSVRSTETSKYCLELHMSKERINKIRHDPGIICISVNKCFAYHSSLIGIINLGKHKLHVQLSNNAFTTPLQIIRCTLSRTQPWKKLKKVDMSCTRKKKRKIF